MTTARAYTGFTSFRQALATLPAHTRTASAVLKDQQIKDSLRLLVDVQRPLAKHILQVLGRHPEGLCASDIAHEIPGRIRHRRYSVNHVQHLLMILRRHHVVGYTVAGKEHIYKADHSRLLQIQRAIHRFTHGLVRVS